MNEHFRHFSHHVSEIAGKASTFFFAVLIVFVWALTGPIFDFSNTWQLFINTMTTILTFLMVFLIQNTQNRDAKAMQLKLDELIRAVHGARNNLVDLETLSDDELSRLEDEFHQLRLRVSERLEHRRKKIPESLPHPSPSQPQQKQ